MVRRKVEIKKIEDKARRHTTFTKRRQGLFKKARELATKCGDEVAIITFSMAGNIYAFGHPSVQSVVHRYENTPEDDSEDAVLGPKEEEAENVVEEEEEEGDDEEDTSVEEVEGEVVVMKEVEEEEELAELDQLEAVVGDMLKEVSLIAKRMIDKM